MGSASLPAGVASLPTDSSPGWVEFDYGAGGKVTAMTVQSSRNAMKSPRDD